MVELGKQQTIPVFLTTYKRLGHLKKTVNALKRNDLACETVLYVTSDGPCPGDETKVSEVRRYVKEIRGFKSVECIFRDVNDRSENWAIRRDLLDRHGCLIQLEEDCVTSPFFLKYMNVALRYYEGDQNVFAICGYLAPFLKQRDTAELKSLAIPRFSAWGFGIWKDSDALVRTRLDEGEYDSLIGDKTFVKMAKDATGLDYMANLWRVAQRGLFAYDLMATLEVMKRDLRCVYPQFSLVNNIGHDGTGEHCKSTSRFEVELAETLPGVELVDSGIRRQLKQHAIFRSGGQRKYIHYKLRLLRGKYRLKSGSVDRQL